MNWICGLTCVGLLGFALFVTWAFCKAAKRGDRHIQEQFGSAYN